MGGEKKDTEQSEMRGWGAGRRNGGHAVGGIGMDLGID